MTQPSEPTSVWLTQKTFDRLNGELEDLRGPRRAEVIARISAARDEGDLKENGGYHAAKEEQGKLELRIRQLTQLLRDVRVAERPSGQVVEEGCLVTVDYGAGDLERFLYANRENATDDGGKIGALDVYSPESPIGQALAGHAVGDAVVFGPRSVSVTVVDIAPYDA